VRYFAEGVTGDFFDTTFALLNPDAVDAHVVLTFLRADGTTVTAARTVPALSQVTIPVDTIAGLERAEFSTIVVSGGGPVAVERTVTWAGGHGSHSDPGVASASRTWYLAEGATHSGFQLFYLVLNPGPAEATLRLEFLLPPPRVPVVKTVTVGAGRRTTLWLNTEPELVNTDVSAIVTSDQAVVVERAMYLDGPDQLFTAGHTAAAVPAPATEWFLAEGATGPYFDLFTLIANPNDSPADVTARFFLPESTIAERRYRVPPRSRFNIWVDAEGGPLADTALATEIASSVPVVVERATWWPGPTSMTWHETHASAGASETGVLWAAPGGACGPGVDTYGLVMNTEATAGRVRVTLIFEDAALPVARVFDLAPTSRFNIVPGLHFGDACSGASRRRFGMLVESLAQGDGAPAAIVVEQARYADAGGLAWAAGTHAVATRLDPATLRRTVFSSFGSRGSSGDLGSFLFDRFQGVADGDLAVAFSSAETCVLSRLDLALTVPGSGGSVPVGSPAVVDVWLMSDADGPADVIEAFKVSLPSPTSKQILSFRSQLQPALLAGQTYWVGASVTTPAPEGTVVIWHFQGVSEAGPWAVRPSPSGPWSQVNDTRRPALQVVGVCVP
jgi:hypothetical protein